MDMFYNINLCILFCVNPYVAQARSHEDFSKVKSVGVDETSRAKGHKYVSVFIDLDKSRVIHVCEGKDASTIESFKTEKLRCGIASARFHIFLKLYFSA